MDQQAALIMTTVATSTDADVVGSALLEQGLAACIQEVPVTSRYRWHGELQRSGEILLLVKTTPAAVDGAIRAIRAVHPYDVPEVLALPVSGGLPAYLEWLSAETARPVA
jgi:periplasmic divalent cation tolerance protein